MQKSAAHRRPMVSKADTEDQFGSVSEDEAAPPESEVETGDEMSNSTDPIDSAEADERMDTAPEPEPADMADSLSNAGWNETEDEGLEANTEGQEKSWLLHRKALIRTVDKSLRGLNPLQKSARLVGLRKAVAIVTMAMPPAEVSAEEEATETPAEEEAETPEKQMAESNMGTEKSRLARIRKALAKKAEAEAELSAAGADPKMMGNEGEEVAAEDDNTPAEGGNLKARTRGSLKSGARVYVPRLGSTGTVRKSLISDGVVKYHVRADVDNKTYAVKQSDVMPARK